MITTSDKWKNAQNQHVVPESFVEITYNLTEPGVQDDATLTNSSVMSYSRPEDIIDLNQRKHYLRYASFEHNSWGLDGYAGFLSDDSDTGFVGNEQSNEAAGFTAMPTVTVTFSKVHEHEIPGITVVWSSAYGEYASRFRVTVYNGETVTVSKEYTNTETTSFIEMPLAGYDKITVDVLEWCLPNRRAKIECLVVGIMPVYTKSDIMRYTHTQTGDLLSAELPKNSITTKVTMVACFSAYRVR